jgi:hypothetical protein
LSRKYTIKLGGKMAQFDIKSVILRLPLIGRVALVRDKEGSAEGFPGGLSFHSHLGAEVIRDGKVIRRIDLGSGLVTTAGVNLMGGDWTNASAVLKLSNNHDSSTGTVAAAIGDTALGVAPPAGVPARAVGTQSNAVANAYKTVGTQTYTAALAITEWGLFSAASAGTMWDHKVFAAVNVVSGDSIQFTYTLTINAGG